MFFFKYFKNCFLSKHHKSFLQFILKLGGLECSYFGIFSKGILKLKRKKGKIALPWKRRQFSHEKILFVDERTKKINAFNSPNFSRDQYSAL